MAGRALNRSAAKVTFGIEACPFPPRRGGGPLGAAGVVSSFPIRLKPRLPCAQV